MPLIQTIYQLTAMNCNKAMVLMSAAIDGELSAKEDEELAQHLADCPECRAKFQDAKKTKIIIKERIVRVKAPSTLIESITRLTTITS
ncbi:MAG: anti-sigma factor family protein [Chlorobaculum sp.]